MSTRETGSASESESSARTLVGFVTVSGDEENGMRVALPKETALDEGIGPGDTLRVEHDPVRGEFVLPYREQT